MIYNILLIVQILVALGIIGLVLIQHGKGADAGAAFGGGSSGTVFGSAGAGSFLSRATAVLAAVFFANSLALAWIVSHSTGEAGSLVDSVAPTPTTKVEVPVSDVPGGVAVPQPAVPVTSDVPTSDIPQQPSSANSSSAVPAASVSPAKVETTPTSSVPASSAEPVPATKAIEEKPVTTPAEIEAASTTLPSDTSANTEVVPAAKIDKAEGDAVKAIVAPAPIVSKPATAEGTTTVAPKSTEVKVEQKSAEDVPQ